MCDKAQVHRMLQNVKFSKYAGNYFSIDVCIFLALIAGMLGGC